MTTDILPYLGALLVVAWGTAHLFPTRSVVAGFGDITLDNKRIITMEWIIEGVALIFIGALVATVAWIDSGAPATRAVHIVSALALLVLSLVSVFTGFRINFLPFRLCPFIFGTAALLFLLGALT